MTKPLLIAGACVRQHVESARRAGYEPLGVDLFADWDTLQTGPCIQARSLDEVPSILQKNPGPWCLAGGLESHLEQLFTPASLPEFLGPEPVVLRRVNDIREWDKLANDWGIQRPQVNFEPICPSGDWLRKPTVSSGGHGVQPAEPGEPRRCGEYFEARIEGASLSGLYLTSQAGTRLLGVTWQLTGKDFNLGKIPFAYAGSIGPLQLDEQLERQFEGLGRQIGEAASLLGIWGADFICSGNTIQLIDLNPRLTASTDLYEASPTFPSIVGLHLEACGAGSPNSPEILRAFNSPNHWGVATGKAIVYSHLDRPTTMDPSTHQWLVGDPASPRTFRFGDIPRTGTEILPHKPICTVYETVSHNGLQLRQTAAGIELPEQLRDLRQLLKKRADQLTGRLRPEDREAAGKRKSDS